MSDTRNGLLGALTAENAMPGRTAVYLVDEYAAAVREPLLAEVQRLKAAFGEATDHIAELDDEIGAASARESALKGELAKRPSRYSASPAEIDDYLRRYFTEEVVLNFQRAVGNRAVEEAAKDIRMGSHTSMASQLYVNGMQFAADHIDPLKGGGHYPSCLLCSKHNGFGQCPGAPWCTPRDGETAS
jgi:hypothetical protein